MKIKLQPASGSELPAFSPLLPPVVVSQVLLLANPHKVCVVTESERHRRGWGFCMKHGGRVISGEMQGRARAIWAVLGRPLSH